MLSTSILSGSSSSPSARRSPETQVYKKPCNHRLREVIEKAQCGFVKFASSTEHHMKRAVLYLRVSTIDQTTANQERELREIAACIS